MVQAISFWGMWSGNESLSTAVFCALLGWRQRGQPAPEVTFPCIVTPPGYLSRAESGTVGLMGYNGEEVAFNRGETALQTAAAFKLWHAIGELGGEGVFIKTYPNHLEAEQGF